MASWLVTGHYNDTVAWPKSPGEVALQVLCKGDSTRDLEVQIFEARDDIGAVDVVEYDERKRFWR